jgi:hypothetical protein
MGRFLEWLEQKELDEGFNLAATFPALAGQINQLTAAEKTQLAQFAARSRNAAAVQQQIRQLIAQRSRQPQAPNNYQYGNYQVSPQAMPHLNMNSQMSQY